MKKRRKSQKLQIKIKDSQRKIRINKKDVVYLAKQILKTKGKTDAELSIVFVGKSRIRKLNKKFRKIDQPTDVLAFAMREGCDFHLHPEILGDVVICPELAGESARVYKTTEENEIYLYLVHGILHLLGYDDTSLKSRSAMEKEQRKILKKIKHGKTKYLSKL